ncbi:hypothetical protein OPT61_g5426 [Boeremia exigua]|uniref:Uncharacterized protein n=1 Tax=Boeremia exigua TaxID=749465 RepID=A0ACC2IAC6_9PLEO|nr:hypothetical protein OPT61_g5426 [Boeremia exigua]
MADAESLPNRQWELIVFSIVFLILGTVFTVWRLFVRTKASKWLGPSDWLMAFGVILNDVDCVLSVLAGFAGAGRLARDPFLTVPQRAKMSRYLFTGQILNIYAMFLVKLSICAYLLALNFSKVYRRLSLGALVFVVIFNFIFPSASLWGLCRPLASRWDIRITDKVCWPITVRIAFGYMQSVSNIITDIFYATAPIVYLRQIQIKKRTQWGVRAVFLMAVVCTTISILKIWDQEMHKGTPEIARDVVPMTLWATAENTVGIVVANLPLLRKPFERIFRSLLQSTSNGTTNADKTREEHFSDFRMQSYRSRSARRSRVEALHNRMGNMPAAGDYESDKAILDDKEKEERSYGSPTGIVKTTEVTVSDYYSRERDDERRGS